MVFEPSWSKVAGHLAARARPGDMVMTLGAGDISLLGPEVLALLRETDDHAVRPGPVDDLNRRARPILDPDGGAPA